MAMITLGVKVDESLRDRLRAAATKLNCSPHALHKQALATYLEAIEHGRMPADIAELATDDTPAARSELSEASARLFYDFAQDVQPQSVLRAAITSAYRRPEPECLPVLIEQARSAQAPQDEALARRLVEALRARRGIGGIEGLIQEFSLSSQEGVALMCLAEALLRIPDRATRDALIRDKISQGDWRSHISGSSSLFVNAATWGLVLTGKLTGINSEQSLSHALTRLIGKGGEPLIRQGVNIAMRMMGEQFVAGQTIASALANSKKWEEKGFRYSYDMLGEAATTAADAERYFNAYVQAIHAIGKAAHRRGIYEGPGISIKLSALHPRFARAHRDRVMSELLPRVVELAELAQDYDIGLNIDAEEADRLDLSLDILEAMCFETELAGWDGIGFVVQAYQKRAPYVIDYIIDLAHRSGHRIMLRLVKGAYWDTEIKRAQVEGLEGYPVYTRKVHTDVSYLACARKLLNAPQAVYPQFATHNARTLAQIYHMAGRNYYPGQYEFQCLHGMGESLYELVTGPVSEGGLNRPCRIYAPVGTHETLLAYLVRRLLENGANTSFVNQLADERVGLDALIADPVAAAERVEPLGAPHDKIPLPRELFRESDKRLNSMGIDLTNEQRLSSLAAALLTSVDRPWRAQPTIAMQKTGWDANRAHPVRNPADHRDIVGYVIDTSPEELARAIENAQHAAPIWAATPVEERARCLRRAARMLEEDMQMLLGLIVREAGKSLSNAIAEVREAVDFLRYYAGQIENGFNNDSHRPLGPVVCISPWNFPLAIFTGQVSAALAAGNTVLAKPAEQTSLIAAAGVDIFHRAGVPADAVQLLPGSGEDVGAALVGDSAIRGVLFTGSTEVAQSISRSLAQRLDDAGRPIPFIAETGGLNAMVVDSSALAEQVVTDVLASAYDSAGQRCSALRLLCIQDDCADRVLTMLRGAMQELRVGRPDRLWVDVGPVIDAQAQATIQQHIDHMGVAGRSVLQLSLPQDCAYGTFVAPTLIEIDSVSDLDREVFGPVLHVLRYRREGLGDLIQSINATGYGLTFGVHTRLDETIQFVSRHICAGNLYVNRNIIGAVVGVQPFGGEALSGTGPKAGGPLYLLRLLSRYPEGLPDWAQDGEVMSSGLALCGPTGESNHYQLRPRGTVLCWAETEAGAKAQAQVCQLTGNRILWMNTAAARSYVESLPVSDGRKMELADENVIDTGHYDALLFEGDSDALRAVHQQVAGRDGPIIPVQGLSRHELAGGAGYRPEPLLREVSVSVNTAAAGGNASLMMIG